MDSPIDVTLLGRLVAAAQHHDQGVAPLDVVHAPARAKVFPHLKEALAHRLHVPQIAELNLAQALDEAQAGGAILQANLASGKTLQGDLPSTPSRKCNRVITNRQTLAWENHQRDNDVQTAVLFFLHRFSPGPMEKKIEGQTR